MPSLLPSKRNEDQTKKAYKMLSDCFRLMSDALPCSHFFLFFFTTLGLCFRLKNVAVLKSPNSKPESIYLATWIQMGVNRSRSFLFFITAAGLCFRLKNAAVLKSPNSEPESIYLATRIQMRVNRSHHFFLELRGYAFVWRMLQCWNPQILNQRVFT